MVFGLPGYGSLLTNQYNGMSQWFWTLLISLPKTMAFIRVAPRHTWRPGSLALQRALRAKIVKKNNRPCSKGRRNPTTLKYMFLYVVVSFFCFHPENWRRWTHFDFCIFFRWVVQPPSSSAFLCFFASHFHFIHPFKWGFFRFPNVDWCGLWVSPTTWRVQQKCQDPIHLEVWISILEMFFTHKKGDLTLWVEDVFTAFSYLSFHKMALSKWRHLEFDSIKRGRKWMALTF